MLILHGDADRTVPVAQTDAFAARVNELGGMCEVVFVPGAPLSVVEWFKHDATWSDALIAWLDDRSG